MGLIVVDALAVIALVLSVMMLACIMVPSVVDRVSYYIGRTIGFAILTVTVLLCAAAVIAAAAVGVMACRLFLSTFS